MKCLLIALFSITSMLHSSPLPSIPLYEGKAPAARGDAPHDIPTLTAYLPTKSDKPTCAILVCPGGGYGGLASHEGEGYAQWLASQGIAGVVLQYRLGTHGYRHPVMRNDAARGMRLLRSKASEWNIDPQRCGIMGSSAGGHLASTLLTQFSQIPAADASAVEQLSCRPDFGILCYPVITMGDFTHAGSKQNLLGNTPSAALIDATSSEKQVTAQTPPCFVWHTEEDQGVPVENALLFASALRRAKVPFDLHVYQKGPHGIGLSQGKHGVAANEVHPWAKDLLFWLSQNRWIP